MLDSPDKNVKRLVDIAKAALARKPINYRVRGAHYLAGHSTTFEIYGEDAALDFIETKWPEMFKHLLKMADEQQTNATVNIPRAGVRARKTIVDNVAATLPGCKISIEGCSMDIDWAKLVKQSDAVQ